MKAADVFTKLDIVLEPDPSRTVVRPFSFEYPYAFKHDAGKNASGQKGDGTRLSAVIARLLALDPQSRENIFARLQKPMHERHRDADAVFRRRFDELSDQIPSQGDLTDHDKMLIGAYFSQEYAFESAALFNPSLARLPNQSLADQSKPDHTPKSDGTVRFIVSLRGVGEGHISSVTFRAGTWHADNTVVLDPVSEQGVPPRIEREDAGWARLICENSRDISEAVLFPILPSQRQGIEDVRLVNFTEDDGTQSLIGTYTAFDGRNVRQELLRIVDMQTFEMRALSGAMTGYKGMALFPRRIDGQFVMLGRQDSENLWLLKSDDLYSWETGQRFMAPQYPWEFVQIGNCGSPIEIDEGWLVFTHGVGTIRAYCIGACLLDKADPSRVLARTPSPLLFPSAEQRGGYVPNVTYSCGALVEGRRVLLPYAIGDERSAFAVASLDDLLSVMVAV